MKRIIQLICLTVMLRVWWSDTNIFSSVTSGNGIVIGSFGEYAPGYLIVRQDDGNIVDIVMGSVYKSEYEDIKVKK